MVTQIYNNTVDVPEIDLSQYDINEGAGIEFTITLKDASKPDKVHVVYARDKQPGPDWVPFQFKFTHGNIRFKTLFVHQDELPYCELYKNAQNPSFKKAEAPRKSESLYFYESAQVMEFIRVDPSEIFRRKLEKMMPDINKLLNESQKNSGEFLQMGLLESSKQMHLNIESLIEGAQMMLMKR